MTQPTVVVETSTADPGATPSWQAISSAFRYATINRGKQGPLDATRPGTAQVVLSNADRKFDPEHSGSALYPNWKPVRRLRITATHNAIAYPLFTGLIDTIRQEYRGPNESVAVVSCVDSMLGAVDLPSSALAVEIRADSPAYWWRLGDPDGSTSALDTISGTVRLAALGAVNFGRPSLGINDADGSVSFTAAAQGLQGILPAGTFPLATQGTVEFLYRYVSTSNINVNFVALGSTLTGVSSEFRGDNIVGFSLQNTAGTLFTVRSTGTPPINDGAVHHIMLTWVAGSNMVIYIDGVDRTGTTAVFTGTMANATNKWLASLNATDYPPYVGTGGVGDYDELALYNVALTAGDAAAHYNAAITAWRGDLSGARFTRILDTFGWPAGDRTIGTGKTTLSSATLGTTALDHLNTVAAAEGGLWYVAKDGKVVFRDRHAGFNLTTQATFGDAGTELRYVDVAYQDDAADIVNIVRRQRVGGLVQEVRDATSIAAYYPRTEEITGLNVGGTDPDGEMLDAANYRLSRSKDPRTRVDQLIINPQYDETNLFPQVLGRELGDQIRLLRRPQHVGAAIDQTLRIEGMAMTIGTKRWSATWSLSGFATAAFLQLDLVAGPGLDSLALAY